MDQKTNTGNDQKKQRWKADRPGKRNGIVKVAILNKIKN